MCVFAFTHVCVLPKSPPIPKLLPAARYPHVQIVDNPSSRVRSPYVTFPVWFSCVCVAAHSRRVQPSGRCFTSCFASWRPWRLSVCPSHLVTSTHTRTHARTRTLAPLDLINHISDSVSKQELVFETTEVLFRARHVLAWGEAARKYISDRFKSLAIFCGANKTNHHTAPAIGAETEHGACRRILKPSGEGDRKWEMPPRRGWHTFNAEAAGVNASAKL